jgi:exopolysaccharide production protein ExoQ
MPPTLALLLCSGFVVYLLRLERKQAPDVSYAIWIPTVWMMSCACKPLASWFNNGQSAEAYGDVESGSPLDRNLLTVLILAGILILVTRKLDWPTFRKNNTWLLVICLYALISIAWSDFPLVSIKRYIRFSGTLLLALVVLSERKPLRAFESILRRTAFVLVPFSLLLIKYFPAFGVMYGRWSGELMWVGVADQKNSAGILFLISSFYLFWRVLREWWERKWRPLKEQTCADVFILFLALYLLKGPPNAFSATSVCAFVLGVSALFWLLWMQSRQKLGGAFILVTVVVILFLYGLGVPFGARTIGSDILQLVGRDPTFTDRDQIWAELIPIAMQRPILGHGYGGFWILATENQVTEAHNGYLDVMLVLGVVGVFLVFAFVVSMCRAAHTALHRDFWWGGLGFCFLIMVVLHNTSEASFFRTSDLLWSLLVFIRVLLPVVTQWHEQNERAILSTGNAAMEYGSVAF